MLRSVPCIKSYAFQFQFHFAFVANFVTVIDVDLAVAFSNKGELKTYFAVPENM